MRALGDPYNRPMRKKAPGFSLILPCHNEASRIAAHVHHCAAVLASSYSDTGFEIIAVNDGSSDDTHAVLHALQDDVPSLRVLSYSHNQGKGHAVRKGVLAARGAVVAYLDADGEISPHHLPVYAAWVNAGWDIVAASKAHPRSNTAFSPWRRRLSALYRGAIARLFGGLPLRDTQAGCKVFRASVAKNVFPLAHAKGYGFDVEWLALAHMQGYSMRGAPVLIRHSDGASSLNIRGIFRMGTETLRAAVRVRAVRVASRFLPTKAEWFAYEFDQ